MIKDKNKPQGITLIMEEFVSVPYHKLKILQESKTEDGIDKIKFKVPLQDAEVVNGNRRFYSKDTCNAIVESLKPMARNRCLFQEIDHPMGNTSDQDTIKRRAIVVEIKNCGSLISDIYMEGNNVYGIIETLSGFRGPDLYNLIQKDNCNIGFSLRAFSRVEPHPKFENVMEVLNPLKAITYDVVSNPSHKTSRMVQFHTESESLRSLLTLNEDENENRLITEAEEILFNDNIKHPNTSREILAQYLNELVREQFDSLRNITFKVGK